MNELFDTLLIPVLVAGLTAIPGTAWYATQRWLIRKGIDLVVTMAVSKVASERVHPLKLENSESPDIRRYDLLPDQARMVMGEAKNETLSIAKQIDANKSWYKPAIAPKIAKDLSKLEPVIERVVQARKGRKPLGPGKGFS